MAGVVIEQPDLANGRVFSMWCEAGIQFRSNLLLHVGSQIELHAHNYDHVSFVTHGVFDAVEITPDGKRREYEARAPLRITIPAWHEHSFVLKEHEGRPGEILCMWGDR